MNDECVSRGVIDGVTKGISPFVMGICTTVSGGSMSCDESKENSSIKTILIEGQEGTAI